MKPVLALLRIAPVLPVPVVALPKAQTETGENVTTIGHPGLGRQTLDYTLTTGVVSNPRQKIDGQDYVQTSAAVNPGTSGGPVFDSRGRVVGLVVLKGNIEAAGFAVPADRLIEFLRACSKAAASTSAPAERNRP